MRFSKDIALSLVVVAGFVLGNLLLLTERYPDLFSNRLNDKERETLGCIDHSASKLLGHFRDAANLNYEVEIPHAARLGWLQMINTNASVELSHLGDCYEDLLSLDNDLDNDGSMKMQVEIIIELYEPIFVGEAVNLSKTIREMVGVNSPQVSPSPVRKPVIDSNDLIDKASNAVNALSSKIAGLVAR